MKIYLIKNGKLVLQDQDRCKFLGSEEEEQIFLSGSVEIKEGEGSSSFTPENQGQLTFSQEICQMLQEPRYETNLF